MINRPTVDGVVDQRRTNDQNGLENVEESQESISCSNGVISRTVLSFKQVDAEGLDGWNGARCEHEE